MGWFWWAVCPQMINLRILRRHFTAHTWLNWGWTIRQVSDIVDMVLLPRKHFREIPSRCKHVLFAWFLRWLGSKILMKEFVAGYSKLLAKLRTGELSANVFTWEKELNISAREFDAQM